MRLALPRAIIVQRLDHRVANIELSALVFVIECEEHCLHKGIGLASRRIVLMGVVVKEEKDLINRIPLHAL